MTRSAAAPLDKAIALLSRIVAEPHPARAQTLIAELDMPRATAYRIMASLERHGLIMRVARGRYSAGFGLLRLAEGASLAGMLVGVARPVLQDLACRLGATAHLGVLEEEMVTYLVKAEQRGAGLFTREGMQLEAYCSGVGKALLAHLPEGDQERYLAGGPFIALTPHTKTDAEELRSEFRRIREKGYAVDDREIHGDVYCLAAPVRDGAGEVLAAVSVSFSLAGSEQPPAGALEALLETIRRLEARIAPHAAMPPP